MQQGWLITVVPVLISTIGAIVSVVISRRAAQVERLSAAEELVTRFREPMLHAIFNLETRIYNIVELNFFGRFLGEKNKDTEKEYAVLNTMYVFAQFFCWVEIMRREAQFIDNRYDHRWNRVYRAKFEAVYETIADSINIQEKCFRLFRGEQRALGEVMLVPVEASKPGFPRWGCMTYPSFVQSLNDEQMARWFRSLREDIEEIRKDVAKHDGRLRLIHHRLIDIVDILDPDAWRIPSRYRERLAAPSS